MFDRIITFLKEVRVEMKKVNWLTRQETTRYTVAIIVVSIVTAIYLGAIDFGLQRLIEGLV